jgi:hypothetical protein
MNVNLCSIILWNIYFARLFELPVSSIDDAKLCTYVPPLVSKNARYLPLGQWQQTYIGDSFLLKTLILFAKQIPFFSPKIGKNSRKIVITTSIPG